MLDLTAIIKELLDERENLDQAIAAMERVALHRGKRRGRPPAWMKLLAPVVTKKRGRPRKK
jgi:hypothetical protein